MAKTVLNVKTDSDVKRKAQKLAKEMGIPLSVIVNSHLRRFINERRFEAEMPLIPNAKTRKILDKALKDLRKGNIKAFSPAFKSAKEMDTWLEKHL